MINGIINVYKEKGFTSHDVVAKLRRIIGQKKIGHTGTLDPDATGVLPVCLGHGTKLCDMLTDRDKVYEAVILFGMTTDTQDISGHVIAQKDVSISEEDAVKVIESFRGEYAQIPPMYSALKINGKKLYELARAGIEVDRKPRNVIIKSIQINEINFSEKEKTITFTVECSKGTYIRTLCHDIGEKLGCGACMKSLKRTKAGRFEIEDSLTLNKIEELAEKKLLLEKVIPVDEMFADYKDVVAGERYSKMIRNGNAVPIQGIESQEKELEHLELVRLYDSTQCFIGIYRVENSMLKPIKMFYSTG